MFRQGPLDLDGNIVRGRFNKGGRLPEQALENRSAMWT